MSATPTVKYLHVIASLNPEAGGPVEGVRQLSLEALRVGHTVEIVTLDAPDTIWAAGFGCTVHNLGPGYLGKYRYAPKFVRWLRDNHHRFEAVIVNGIWQYHALGTWLTLRNSSTPYFLFTHGMLDPWFRRRYPLKHLKKWLYWPWAEYRILRDARAVLFTCEEERRLARQSFSLYRANEVIVRYGSPGPKIELNAAREQFLQQFPGLRDRRSLLFLSRLHPKKGCDILIRAFAALAAEQRDLQLIMAGPDQTGWQQALQDLARSQGIADRITWTGMLTGDAKWGAYRAAEAFILPSHSENFGIVVAEALACGTPVLISNKVNIWREVSDANAGLIADDSVPATLEMLRTWCELSNLQRQQMGANARRVFLDQFEIGIAARSLLAAIDSHASPPSVAVAAGA